VDHRTPRMPRERCGKRDERGGDELGSVDHGSR
jgi:hypothetical protein